MALVKGLKSWGRLFSKAESGNNLIQINVHEVSTNPYQPRQEFDEMELRELAGSIHEVGLIQPIVVRKCKTGYEVVTGERRLRACKLLGLTEIPALLMELDDQRVAAISLVENLQRKDLNYFEEAAGYARLINDFNLTQEEVAQKVGKSQSAIANKLRLLRLSPEVRNWISPDTVSERHVRALLKLETVEEQIAVLQLIYERELTVRETEEVVERVRQNISQEINKQENRKKVSGIVRDARIFVNTIKETVARAKSNGVEMMLIENESEEVLEMIIRVRKAKK
ncbi:MAG: ParB/RepB/Spo0J family partition protein [Firmicutes bacterium]|nr:ParB/RepB/Spo0J family partition protein [Bacillota bacterium]